MTWDGEGRRQVTSYAIYVEATRERRPCWAAKWDGRTLQRAPTFIVSEDKASKTDTSTVTDELDVKTPAACRAMAPCGGVASTMKTVWAGSPRTPSTFSAEATTPYRPSRRSLQTTFTHKCSPASQSNLKSGSSAQGLGGAKARGAYLHGVGGSVGVYKCRETAAEQCPVWELTKGNALQ